VIWKNYNGQVETIKSMKNSRIKSNINYVYNSNKTDFNGFSKAYWILQFKAELYRRRQMEEVVINGLPFIRKKLNEIKYDIKYNNTKFLIK